MSDLDFRQLRAKLEADSEQPSFEIIRARRQRRTIRLALAGTVTATLIVLVGGVVVVGGAHRSAPAGPATPSPATATPDAGSLNVNVEALTATAAGTLYAITSGCDGACDAASTTAFTLSRSTDHGTAWTPTTKLNWVSIKNGGPVLLATDDAHLWVLADGTVGVSGDDGLHWQHEDLGGDPTGQPHGSAAGDTAWFGWKGQVLRAPAGQLPTATAALPATTTGINAVVAVNAVEAVAQAVSAGIDVWYGTTDAGAHWTKLADPCAGTSFAVGSPWTTTALGPDGTRWAVCGAAPGADQPKDLLTSTDAGKTWQNRGSLESTGHALDVHPVSATTAWRTGPGSDVYRTTDSGVHWSDVASTGPRGGATAFTAVDADTALYYAAGSGSLTAYTTGDGGRTWTSHPAPGMK